MTPEESEAILLRIVECVRAEDEARRVLDDLKDQARDAKEAWEAAVEARRDAERAAGESLPLFDHATA
jgi:ArsR family metal-binding transcriptional regulator